jgi:hypothetical protein
MHRKNSFINRLGCIVDEHQQCARLTDLPDKPTRRRVGMRKAESINAALVAA